MATGLLALLDDIAAIAKVAASSLDDIAGQAAKAGMKAAGVVIDDAAVTPNYVVGFAAERELPIVWKIALGSLRNKLLFLLPAALVLSLIAPWVITPLLLLGGLYLCYEGAEKVYEALFPHAAHGHADAAVAPTDPKTLEDQKVQGAIATDFILSAEIMAITLATLEGSFWLKAIILAIVGVAITAIVYGAVALIVKADDVGVRLAARKSAVARAVGRGLVVGMPTFLKVLSVVGTAAMLWVGGGIIIHSLAEMGVTGPEHVVEDIADTIAHAVPALEGLLHWLVAAAIAGIVGLVIGAILIPVANSVIIPLLKRVWPKRRGAVTAAPAAH